MTDPLHIEIAREGHELVLRLAGEFDLTTANEFVRCVDELTQITREPRIVVDTSQVTFIDSTGAQALILANRRCVDAEGGLAIRSPSKSVLQILQVTGLDQVLTVDTD